jgi:hypothetical protein
MELSKNLKILIESPVKVPSKDLVILQESRDSSNNVDKIAFRTLLQQAEEVNGNKRYYSKNTCNMIVEDLKGKADGRCLFQEIDHPFVSSTDPEIMKKRAIIVELKNCGSMIRNIRLDGNDIIGEVETLSGFMGPSLRDLIIKDKADIGFSLRMFSRVQDHPKMTGVMEVVGPVKTVTYDVVTNPSHSKARVVTLLNENQTFASLLTNDEAAIMECINELSELGEHVNAPRDSIVSDYLKSLVAEAFDNQKTLFFHI